MEGQGDGLRYVEVGGGISGEEENGNGNLRSAEGTGEGPKGGIRAEGRWQSHAGWRERERERTGELDDRMEEEEEEGWEGRSVEGERHSNPEAAAAWESGVVKVSRDRGKGRQRARGRHVFVPRPWQGRRQLVSFPYRP